MTNHNSYSPSTEKPRFAVGRTMGPDGELVGGMYPIGETAEKMDVEAAERQKNRIAQKLGGNAVAIARFDALSAGWTDEAKEKFIDTSTAFDSAIKEHQLEKAGEADAVAAEMREDIAGGGDKYSEEDAAAHENNAQGLRREAAGEAAPLTEEQKIVIEQARAQHRAAKLRD